MSGQNMYRELGLIQVLDWYLLFPSVKNMICGSLFPSAPLAPNHPALVSFFTILKIAFIWIIDITQTVIFHFYRPISWTFRTCVSCSHASAVTEGQRFVHMCYRISHHENTITPKMSADTERGPNWRLRSFCYSLINWCRIFHPNCHHKALWWNSKGSLLNFIFTCKSLSQFIWEKGGKRLWICRICIFVLEIMVLNEMWKMSISLQIVCIPF